MKTTRQALYEDLTDTFIIYQYRLDHPMPLATETSEVIRLKFLSDPIFHAKVERLVAGIMTIVNKHISTKTLDES